MTKSIAAILLVFLLGFFAVACGDDDDKTSGVSSSALTGSWSFTRTEGGETEIKSLTFAANMVYIETIESRGASSTNWTYRTGTWEVSGANICTIATQEGGSSTSAVDAIASVSAITEANRIKRERVAPVITSTKISWEGFTGGNVSTLEGVWGSLTTPSRKEYRMKTGTWSIAEESYTKITLTSGATNYQTISKRWHDGSSWLTTAPEYKNEAGGSWGTSPLTNTYPITKWTKNTADVEIEIGGGAMTMTNTYITSGSSLGFDVWTKN